MRFRTTRRTALRTKPGLGAEWFAGVRLGTPRLFRAEVVRFVLAACVCAAGMPYGAAYGQAAGPPADPPRILVVPDSAAQRVDVRVDGVLFTAYVYADTLSVLKKPVLYPLHTASGVAVTRGYPLDPVAGERVDHPHHIGLWLNYGDVNGLDFWNNSDAIPPERTASMGVIRHRAVVRAESGEGQGALEVAMDWLAPDGAALLREDTRFVFRAEGDLRMVDRIATLTALDEAVSFEDNKEGVLGLRVARALELPSEHPVEVLAADGSVVRTQENEQVTGQYRNSKGVAGYPDVWGKRARWMMLSGTVEGRPVTVAMLDHPENPGFPTYWHARDYGLFAANPFGQAVFTEGKEALHFALAPGASTTLRYRIILFSGHPSPDDVEAAYRDFVE